MSKLPGVRLVEGQTYYVERNLIEFANQGNGFYNPRYALLITHGIPDVCGLGEDEMAELGEAIRTEGLTTIPVCRWFDDGKKIQCLNGERRLRAIDTLIDNGVDCWSPKDKAWIPAKKLYASIRCDIYDADDTLAMKLAFSGNERAIGIGEAATVAWINVLRAQKKSDQEILSITGKSTTWLKACDDLSKLDKKTYETFCQGRLNQTAALYLSDIEDVEKRHGELANLLDHAIQRKEEKKKKILEEIKVVQDKQELAEAEVAAAAKKGKSHKVDESKKKVREIDATLAEKKKELQKLETSKPKVGSKDIQKVSGKTKPLTIVKVQKHWYQRVQELIEANDASVNIRDAHLVKRLCEALESGEGDIEGILFEFNSQYKEN